MRALAAALLAATLLGAAPTAAGAWSDATRTDLAWRTRRLAPPDLAPLLARHATSFEEAWRGAGPDAPGGLTEAVTAAVGAIRSHRPMAEVVARVGLAAARAAELNDPVAAADEAGISRFAADYRLYVDSARPRFAPVFYGLEPTFDRPDGLDRLARAARERGRQFALSLGNEYRRTGGRAGREAFDDRSTAFAVGALSFSRALTDAVQIVRLVWIRGGGADRPGRLPVAGGSLRLVPVPSLAP